MEVWCLKCFIFTDSSDEQSTFDGLQKIIICSFISFLSLYLNKFLQSEIMQKLFSVQKITRTTTVFDKKIIVYSAYLGYCATHLSLLVELNSFVRQALFSLGMQNGREKKLLNVYMLIQRFIKDVIDLFCCQGYLKHFLKDYRFWRKSGNDAYNRSGGGMSCYLRHYDALCTKIDM